MVENRLSDHFHQPFEGVGGIALRASRVENSAYRCLHPALTSAGAADTAADCGWEVGTQDGAVRGGMYLNQGSGRLGFGMTRLAATYPLEIDSSGDVYIAGDLTVAGTFSGATTYTGATSTNRGDNSGNFDDINLGAANCGYLELNGYYNASTTYTVRTTACSATSIVLVTRQSSSHNFSLTASPQAGLFYLKVISDNGAGSAPLYVSFLIIEPDSYGTSGTWA